MCLTRDDMAVADEISFGQSILWISIQRLSGVVSFDTARLTPWFGIPLNSMMSSSLPMATKYLLFRQNPMYFAEAMLLSFPDSPCHGSTDGISPPICIAFWSTWWTEHAANSPQQMVRKKCGLYSVQHPCQNRLSWSGCSPCTLPSHFSLGRRHPQRVTRAKICLGSSLPTFRPRCSYFGWYFCQQRKLAWIGSAMWLVSS